MDAAKTPARVEPATTTVRQAVLGDYVPAAFLLWAVFGMVRPLFDPGSAFDPIFWYVGGASLLTIYGRLMTRDVDGDEDDGESLDDKWRFTIPHLWRKGPT